MGFLVGGFHSQGATFAQQKDKANRGIVQQRDLTGIPEALGEFGELWRKEDEAYNNNNAAALAPLFTRDAVLLAPEACFSVGRLSKTGMQTCFGSGQLLPLAAIAMG